MLVDLILTIFGYLLVPIILVITGGTYPLSKLKKIVIINGIVVWLIFSIIIINAGGESSNGGAAILWSFVGYWILKKRCLEDEDATQQLSASSHNYQVHGSDITLEKTKRVCPYCGVEITDNQKYCSNCGNNIY